MVQSAFGHFLDIFPYMFQERRLIKVIRLNREHDNHGAMMRLTFGDTHYRNYELGFSVKTNVKEKDQEVEVDAVSRKGDRPLIFSRETKKKKTQPRASGPTLHHLSWTHAEAEIYYRWAI